MTSFPVMHSAQRQALKVKKDNRFMVMRCGRRFGKTELLDYVSMRTAGMYKRVGLFYPTYKLMIPTYRKTLTTFPRWSVESASKIDQSIHLTGGGVLDFWTLKDENAGRSRWYDLIIIDEASLVNGLQDIFEQSIAPTLLDHAGHAIMAGTPKGVDMDSYFYRACSDPDSRWKEFHAPTSANPLLDPKEVASLIDQYPPLVYQQEYLAEFVDWRGVAFFAEGSMLVNGEPVVVDNPIEAVYAVIDTAMKDGNDHDATGVVYFGRETLHRDRLLLLDYDIVSIESDLLSCWLPNVERRCEELAREYRSRHGWSGPYIEDKSSGITLLQHARKNGMSAEAIPEQLVSMGKEGRALNVSGYVHSGKVKFVPYCYNKTVEYRERVRNELIGQVCGFRIGEKMKHEMDLLDCFTYGVALGLGNSEGF